jgi:hypothetical protein
MKTVLRACFTLALFFTSLLMANPAMAGTVRSGSAPLEERYWAPDRVVVEFEPSPTPGIPRSFGICFTMTEENLTLYKSWKLVRDNGTEYPYPFVLEVKLVISDRSLNWTGTKSGKDWYFGQSEASVGEAGRAGAYLDTQLSDEPWGGKRVLGIGIPLPSLLQAGQYCFAMTLGLESNVVGSFDGTWIMTRLGIDVRVATKLGYNPSERFDNIGGGWSFWASQFSTSLYPDSAYSCPAAPLYRPDPQMVTYDAFAIGGSHASAFTPSFGSQGLTGVRRYRLRSSDGSYEEY